MRGLASLLAEGTGTGGVVAGLGMGKWTDRVGLIYTDAIIRFDIVGFTCYLIRHPLSLLSGGSILQPGKLRLRAIASGVWSGPVLSPPPSTAGGRDKVPCSGFVSSSSISSPLI